MRFRAATSPSRWEIALLVFTLLAIGGALSAFDPNGQVIEGPQTEVQQISEAGDAMKQLIMGFVYLLNLMLLVRSVRPWAWRFLGLPLMALTAWCFTSVLWSAIPDGTLRRAAALSGAVIVGLYAGLRYNEQILTRALAIAAGLAAIGSALWAVAFRARAFDTDGNLRGLFYHKNAFGAFLALTILAVIYRMIILRRRSLANGLLLAMLFGSFALAHSATPIVAMLAGLTVLAGTVGLQRSQGLLAPMLIGLLCLSLAVFLLFGTDIADAVAEILGRSTTLSGRTTIWGFVIPMIGAHPWVGYGYGIFWLGETAPGALFWYWTKQFELHAHDGFLQLMLDTGIVGLAFYLTSLGLLIARVTRLTEPAAMPLVRWVALFLGYYLVCNITDTELWQANSLLTTVYIWAVTRVNLETWCQVALQEVSRKPTTATDALMSAVVPVTTGQPEVLV
ncbi:MAG TPA: O-antigen ligase family protein [Rhodopila sp.]|nr:O-antigen ligase family protein [Rhodopila sp.]